MRKKERAYDLEAAVTWCSYRKTADTTAVHTRCSRGFAVAAETAKMS